MSFTDRLVELKRESGRHGRYFKAIEAGDYTLSIQGSHGHYCTPRMDVHPHEYTSMEMALWNTKKHSRSFIHFTRSSVMRAFPRYAELLDCSDGKHPTVFGYVPIDLLEDFINYLTS